MLDIDFIGIGAQKSATTWLFKCLEEHPEIFIPEEKETHFFEGWKYSKNKLEWYKQKFSGSSFAKVKGEFTTSYLSSESALHNICINVDNEKIKFLVSLRNPIDQIYSHYWHLLGQNFHSGDTSRLSFEDALDSYPERLIEPALYHKHLKKWYQVFDEKQFLIVLYDDIKSRPEEIVKNIYNFLVVNKEFVPSSLVKHDTSVRKGGALNTGLSGKIYPKLFKFLVNFYMKGVNKFGEEKMVRLKENLNTRVFLKKFFFKDKYPTMNEETRKMLYSLLKNDIENLSNLLGKDLSNWE